MHVDACFCSRTLRDIRVDSGTSDFDDDFICDLQMNDIAVHAVDGTVDTAYRHDRVIDFQAIQHVLAALLLSLLRAVQHEIKQNHYRNQRAVRTDHC